MDFLNSSSNSFVFQIETLSSWISEGIVLPSTVISSAGIWSVPGYLCGFTFSVAILTLNVLFSQKLIKNTRENLINPSSGQIYRFFSPLQSVKVRAQYYRSKHSSDEKFLWYLNNTNLKKQHKGKIMKVNTNTKDAIKEIKKIFLNKRLYYLTACIIISWLLCPTKCHWLFSTLLTWTESVLHWYLNFQICQHFSPMNVLMLRVRIPVSNLMPTAVICNAWTYIVLF